MIKKSEDESLHTPQLAQETLKTVLWLAADIAPIPLAVLLFAKGIVGVHHLYRVHRMARGADDAHGARRIINEVAENVPSMSAEEARDTIDVLMDHYEH